MLVLNPFAKYFVNNVMCGWNLFIVLLTNGSSSICFEWPQNEADISKSITCVGEKQL